MLLHGVLYLRHVRVGSIPDMFARERQELSKVSLFGRAIKAPACEADGA